MPSGTQEMVSAPGAPQIAVTVEHKRSAEARLRRGTLSLINDSAIVAAIEAITDDRERLAAAAAEVVRRLPSSKRERALISFVNLYTLVAEMEAIRQSLSGSFVTLKNSLESAEERFGWQKEWQQETRRVLSVVLRTIDSAKKSQASVDARLDDIAAFCNEPQEHLERIVAARSVLLQAADTMNEASLLWALSDSGSLSSVQLYERVSETARRLGGRYAVRKGWKQGSDKA